MKNRVRASPVPTLLSSLPWSSLIIFSTFLSNVFRMLLVSVSFSLYILTSLRIQQSASSPITLVLFVCLFSSPASQSKDITVRVKFCCC